MERIYLNIAFFYLRKEWYNFLIKAIIPFLNRNKSFFHRFYLSLASIKGDHIRLTFLTDKDHSYEFAQIFDTYFQRFIKDHPSSSIDTKDHSVGMYMDFPNNAIQYGIFDIAIKSQELHAFDVYQSEISKVILSIFKSYQEETPENLTEIILEMYAWFCASMNLNINKSIELFENLLETSYNQYEGSLLDKIRKNDKENFEDNKKPIVEYIISFFNQTEQEIEYEWQGIWTAILKEVKKRLSAEDSEPINYEDYKYLLASIPRLFAIENPSQAYYLFFKGLKEIKKNSYE